MSSHDPIKLDVQYLIRFRVNTHEGLALIWRPLKYEPMRTNNNVIVKNIWTSDGISLDIESMNALLKTGDVIKAEDAWNVLL